MTESATIEDTSNDPVLWRQPILMHLQKSSAASCNKKTAHSWLVNSAYIDAGACRSK